MFYIICHLVSNDIIPICIGTLNIGIHYILVCLILALLRGAKQTKIKLQPSYPNLRYFLSHFKTAHDLKLLDRIAHIKASHKNRSANQDCQAASVCICKGKCLKGPKVLAQQNVTNVTCKYCCGNKWHVNVLIFFCFSFS